MFSSLHKALNVLEAFTLGAPEWGVTELAAKLGIPESTVHRTVVTLEGRGYARQHHQTGKCRLGVKLWELGSVVINSLGLRGAARLKDIPVELTMVGGRVVHQRNGAKAG